MPILKTKKIHICYESLGNPQNPTVVFISGITTQLIRWPSAMLQGLIQAGFHVVIFDNRDVGLSSYYDHLPTPSIKDIFGNTEFTPPYTLNDMANDVIMLMDRLHINRAHIVGISMGGQIAQILAIEYPDRILSFTGIATSSGDPDLPLPSPDVLAFFMQLGQPLPDLAAYVNNAARAHKIFMHPDDLDLKNNQMLCEKEYNRAYHPSGGQRQLLAVMTAAPRGTSLKMLSIPSLIIHGDYDPVITIEHGYQLAQCLACSKLLVIEKLGHGLPERTLKICIPAMREHFNSLKRV